MEYCGVFRSPLSQHSCIGYEGTPYGSATSQFVGEIATTYATPQAFAEMPTPGSWHGAQAIAHGQCNCCYMHQTQIQSSCVQDGSTNISEHYMEEMPQHYGFHNLNRRSVVLADGTEHSFYALPENYPLERATSDPVFDACADEMDGCSTEFVDVLAGLPEKQTYEQEQNESAQPTKYSFERATSSTFPAMNCIVAEKHTHPGQETPSILDMLAQVQAKLETIIESYGSMKQRCERISFGTEKKAASVTSILSQDTCEQEQLPEETGQTSTYFSKASENEITSHYSPVSDTATDQMQFQAFESKPVYDAYNEEEYACLNSLGDVFAGTPKLQPYEEEQEKCEHAPKCISKPIFSLGRATVGALSEHATDFTSTHVPYLFAEEPIECPMTNRDTKLHSLPDLQLGNTIGRAQDVATQLWNKLLNGAGQQAWDPGIGISSSLYHLSQSLMAANARRLSSLQTPQRATWLSQLSIASYVWDPGTMLLLPKSTWLLLVTEEKERVALIPEQLSFRCNAMHYCKIFQRSAAISSLFHSHGIPLWLINFQVP